MARESPICAYRRPGSSKCVRYSNLSRHPLRLSIFSPTVIKVLTLRAHLIIHSRDGCKTRDNGKHNDIPTSEHGSNIH